MSSLTQEAIIELAISFTFYLVIGIFGAFIKDLHETLTKKNEKIRFGEVLVGGATAAFLCLGLQDSWLKDLSLNGLVIVTFIAGILGFELFGNIATIDRFRNTINTVLEIRNAVLTKTSTSTESNKNTKDNVGKTDDNETPEEKK